MDLSADQVGRSYREQSPLAVDNPDSFDPERIAHMSDSFVEAHASAKLVFDHRLCSGTFLEKELAFAYWPVGLSLVENGARDRTCGDHAS